ncbi:hypothetical protein P261_01708 [Lachnospiraceae bacterium TWA4]|nr:hypothetical protein P261_01708 [Lachnospiraceae bacterium TWA4]
MIKENPNFQIKDFPLKATSDFTAKCRMRANENSPWSDWTDLPVHVYNQKVAFKCVYGKKIVEIGSVCLDPGEKISLLNIYPDILFTYQEMSKLNPKKLSNLYEGFNEGYDYIEETDGKKIQKDAIGEKYDSTTFVGESRKGRKVFYIQKTTKTPDNMEVYLDYDMKAGGYYQTLKKIDNSFAEELDIPYGIHSIKFDEKTSVNTVHIPSTVMKIEAKNFNVNTKFIVDSKNQWFYTSENGKVLFDKTGKEILHVDSGTDE